MVFKTHSGKMSPDEIEQLMEVIKLYSTKKLMKAKSGLPDSHYVEPEKLEPKNDQWRDYIEKTS